MCKRTATPSFSPWRQAWHVIILNVTSSCQSTSFVQNSCHSVALSGGKIITVITLIANNFTNFSFLTITSHESPVTHLTPIGKLQNYCKGYDGAILEFGVCSVMEVYFGGLF